VKTKLCRNWYQSTGIPLLLGSWTFFFNFKRTQSWILQKNFLPPLEPKLLVMLGRIWKRSNSVRSVVHFLAPIVLVLESVQHIMVWHSSPLAPIGKIKSGKQNIMKRFTTNSDTSIPCFCKLVSDIHHFQRFTNSFPYYQ
jgi:hypothetical protein